ncbi:MAG: hypothetical protein NDI73_06350 [Desulfuromonadales bacterium]|nr:hypothetical protein [Desulfuromonadales bacterium]
MSRFLAILLWTAVFLLILLAIDQLLVRVPASMPAHVAVTDFYRDLRRRAFDLAKGEKPAPAKPPAVPAAKGPPQSIEAVIVQRQAKPAVVNKPPAPAPAREAVKGPSPKEPAPRYVYADNQGELHFAETLAEVPEEYRGKAKRLGE